MQGVLIDGTAHVRSVGAFFPTTGKPIPQGLSSCLPLLECETSDLITSSPAKPGSGAVWIRWESVRSRT